MARTTPPTSRERPRRIFLRPSPTRHIDLWLIGGLLLLALFLLPVRNAALRGDDTWVSEMSGEYRLQGLGLWDAIRTSMDLFLDSGRPSVGGVAQGVAFAWVLGDHPVLYRLVLIAVTVFCAALLYALVRRMGLDRPASLLTLVLLAGALQLRSFHDALAGYWGTTQLTLLFVLASVLAFQSWLATGRPRTLIVSVALFLPAPLLYEGSYPMVALFLALALVARRGLAAWKAAAPFLGIGVLFVAVSLFSRATSSNVAAGYEVGTSPLAALRTFLIQLITPVPASDLVFNPNVGGFAYLGFSPTVWELAAGFWRGAVVFAVVIVVGVGLGDGRWGRLPRGPVLRALAIVGAVLWTTSVMAIAVAPKYQGELVPGRGHVTALMQAFGWALVAVAALLALLGVARDRSRAALIWTALVAAGALGLGAGATGYHTLRIVGSEQLARMARVQLEQAISAGVLDGVPERGTVIFTSSDITWTTGSWHQYPPSLEGMLFDKSGRVYDARSFPYVSAFDCPAGNRFPPTECAPPSADVAWVRLRTRRDGASVLVSTMAGGAAPAENPAIRVRAWSRRDDGDVGPPPLVGRASDGAEWSSSDLRWRIVARADDWAIFETSIPATDSAVASSIDDSTAQIDFAAPPAPDDAVRFYGTRRLLP